MHDIISCTSSPVQWIGLIQLLCNFPGHRFQTLSLFCPLTVKLPLWLVTSFQYININTSLLFILIFLAACSCTYFFSWLLGLAFCQVAIHPEQFFFLLKDIVSGSGIPFIPQVCLFSFVDWGRVQRLKPNLFIHLCPAAGQKECNTVKFSFFLLCRHNSRMRSFFPLTS